MSAYGTLFPLTTSGWTARARYNTHIIVGKNGQEVRNANWQDPLLAYNAAFAVRSYADIATLQTFFHGCKGREQSFLVKDWADYSVAPWEAFAETVDGSRTTFQLIKRYVQGVLPTYIRNITKPKAIEGAGGVTIRDNSVAVATANYAFSSSTGIVTFSTPPVAGHVVDFKIEEFYVPCRFDVDELPIEMLNFWVDSLTGVNKGLIQIPDVPLVEVRGE